MEYFKINYSKLENLHQIKFYIVVLIILFIFIFLIFCASMINITKKISLAGYYNEGVLYTKINNKLSDILKNNKQLKFNNQKAFYEIINFGEYEIIDNQIYQEVDLAIEENFINNEVGIIELQYNKQKIIKYIFELFK